LRAARGAVGVVQRRRKLRRWRRLLVHDVTDCTRVTPSAIGVRT
jgi:hypothetical protein